MIKQPKTAVIKSRQGSNPQKPRDISVIVDRCDFRLTANQEKTKKTENGEENVSFDVRDFTIRHKHLSKRKKTLPVLDRDQDVNVLVVRRSLL